MHISGATLLTAALAGQAAARIHGHHKHHHASRHSEMLRSVAEPETKREASPVESRDLGSLLSYGLKALGINPTSSTAGKPWLGNDGAYTNEFINQSDEPLYLVIWGAAGSWVNAIQPDITVRIPAGASTNVSFPSGSTGAWAPIYPDTKLVMGQVSETWGEFTFNEYSTIDVSREVNMNGRNMRVETPKCTTDMNTCVFVCPNGQETCWFGYELLNCTPGSQPGANYGLNYGAPSGGCSGMGESAQIKTYLGYTS